VSRLTKADRERLNARTRARYRENPALFRVRADRWARKNPEKVSAIGRRWRQKHREQVNAINRAYYWRNVEALRAKHRARKRAWKLTWTPEKRKQVAAKKRGAYYKKVKRESMAMNGNASVSNLRLLSARAQSALLYANLKTVGAVRRSLGKGELQQYRNCGPQTVDEICKAVGFKAD
jgi:hypothetical protein